MAGRGFPPQPTALKALRGNPGRRPLNAQEPKVPPGIPAPPAELDAAAGAEWRRVVALLAEAKLVTRLDRAGLAGYCAIWSRWLAVEALLREQGTIVQDKKGIPVLNPLVAKAGELLAQMRPFLAEFGMTPSSRSRIRIPESAPEGELAAFRRRHG